MFMFFKYDLVSARILDYFKYISRDESHDTRQTLYRSSLFFTFRQEGIRRRTYARHCASRTLQLQTQVDIDVHRG
jgi:hypothetical protein